MKKEKKNHDTIVRHWRLGWREAPQALPSADSVSEVVTTASKGGAYRLAMRFTICICCVCGRKKKKTVKLSKQAQKKEKKIADCIYVNIVDSAQRPETNFINVSFSS